MGSNVITQDDGSLNGVRILHLVEDIAYLRSRGTEVILVSSGAVASGQSEVRPSRKTNEVTAKQIWASIGQVKLMSSYQSLFGYFGITVGQLLATKESFMDRKHYLNMKNCISAMLENNVLPIVNENDSVTVDELMFTDNDELSGLISSMMDCGSLFLLTNVDGVYNADPRSREARLIREIRPESDDAIRYISNGKSGFGRGGMISKYTVARKIAMEGIDVFIANGNRDSIIPDIIKGKKVPYTHFVSSMHKKNGIKKWLAHSDAFAKGAVVINNGARLALLGDKASSLLMVGIVRVEGYFKCGDIVRILDEEGCCLGLGKANFDSTETARYLGTKLGKPFIHYDYLCINEDIKHNNGFGILINN